MHKKTAYILLNLRVYPNIEKIDLWRYFFTIKGNIGNDGFLNNGFVQGLMNNHYWNNVNLFFDVFTKVPWISNEFGEQVNY